MPLTAENSWMQTDRISVDKGFRRYQFSVDKWNRLCIQTNNGEYVDDFWKIDPARNHGPNQGIYRLDEDYDDDILITRTNGVAFR